MALYDRATRCIATKCLGIDNREVSFARRGFHVATDEARDNLEAIGAAFLAGYRGALKEHRQDRLGKLLERIETARRGFAYEGAAMALALLDRLVPFTDGRWKAFLAGSGANHPYVLHVGYGWTVARLPWMRRRVVRELQHFDPFLRWLVLDGYGFHEGYFHCSRYVAAQDIPANLTGYARRAFDQGLGRSLWFVGGADPDRILQLMSRFHAQRRPDLWSGVGLACAYAGGCNYRDVMTLRQHAHPFESYLAQGAAFAAKARQRAGIPTDHTEIACDVLCGMSADSAAAVTDASLTNLAGDETLPAFEAWRRRIQSRMASTAEGSMRVGV